jgi:hypothetical protein
MSVVSILPVERRLALPNPHATALVRLVTVSFAADGSKDLTPWVINKPHPLTKESKIVRMYHRDDGGVEVYSTDGRMFIRTFIPGQHVVFFDEMMSEDTFIAFIDEAEADEEEEEEEEEEVEQAPAEPEPEPPSPPSPPDEQSTVS